ncbi:MAG: DNA sulfur modification protein DndB [Candidatus Delongbacteria bacterium]|nr:DNA sulfur modification protein DndB [Candidatus Delongbacteria bacterium]
MQIAEYVFTALRGIQAGREYYVVMCPLKLVPKIFLFQEDELPAELRSQRNLNKARIPEIAHYISDNQNNYIFSSLTASIDSKVKFEKLTYKGNEIDIDEIGKLKVPMDSKILINDGQHRRAAIEASLKENPELGAETISIVFFIDVGLKRSQQMFADLNKHAVRPTKSIGIYYDHRDPLSNLAKELINKNDIFKFLTEIAKTSISNRSTKLFTLSSIYAGTKDLLNKKKKHPDISKKEINLTIDFWDAVVENIPDWILAAKRDVSTHELRLNFVHSHGLMVHALGRLGRSLIEESRLDFNTEMKKLRHIDWRRSNVSIWEGRAMHNGKISKSHDCLILTTNYLKQQFKLPLKEDELELEKKFLEKI